VRYHKLLLIKLTILQETGTQSCKVCSKTWNESWQEQKCLFMQKKAGI